jgi:hypothetical protein
MQIEARSFSPHPSHRIGSILAVSNIIIIIIIIIIISLGVGVLLAADSQSISKSGYRASL